MAKYVFGIDLGTTYSCISYVDETGRPVVINNSEGTNTTPSVVNFASESQVVVGQVAKESAVIEPEKTISLVKRLIGRTDFAIEYNGEDKSPEEVSAYILRKLASDAGQMIDTEVSDVVITCPAYFGTAERTATKNAGIIAGLNVLEIISEPTAAAIFYGCTKEQDQKTILVYDLGGGTFDVTIMTIGPEKIEVICSEGNHELGGKDWDEALIGYLVNEFKSETGFDDELDEYAQQDVRLKAETAKMQLTSREQIPVMMDVAGLRAKIDVSRETFNDITMVLLDETINKTDEAIAIAEGKGYKVDEILLVGGSTRMPQVMDALKSKYGMDPKVVDPDEAVAKGAAIHAVNVYVNNQKSIAEWEEKVESGEVSASDEDDGPPVENKEDYKEDLNVNQAKIGIGGKVKEVVVATTKSYAIEILYDGNPKCCNMILKNEPMPDGSVSVTREFGTASKNQDTVVLTVYEEDFMEEYFDVDSDYVLGEAELTLPSGLPEGAPIEITFTLSAEGMLDVHGRCLTSGNKIHATMQAKGIMAEEKVEELKEKSKGITVM